MGEKRKHCVGSSFTLLFCNEDEFCTQNEQKFPKECLLKKNLDKMMDLLVASGKEAKELFYEFFLVFLREVPVGE